jgi:hypothetical protein
MSTSRIARTVTILIPLFAIAGCASTPDQYAAAKECKIVPATFVNVPKKDPTPAERAEAQLKFQRFAYMRRDFNNGTDMPAQAVRDCY